MYFGIYDSAALMKGSVKSFMKNGTAYGTTEDTEKDSVSSRKKIERQRDIAGWEIDPLVEGEAVFGEIDGFITTGAQRGGNDNSLNFLKLHNFSGFSVVIF